MWCSKRVGGQVRHLGADRRRLHRQHVVEPAAEHHPQHVERRRRHRRAAAARAAEHRRPGRCRTRRAARRRRSSTHEVELGAHPLGGQHLQVEGGHDHRRRRARRACGARRRASGTAAAPARGPGRASRPPRPAPGPAWCGRGRRAAAWSPSTSSTWLTMSSWRPWCISSRTWLSGSSRAPNCDVRLAHALGDGADLAVVLPEQDDDPVGLAELVRAQHDAGVAVQMVGHRRHASTPPKRRLRVKYSATAAFTTIGSTSAPASRR